MPINPKFQPGDVIAKRRVSLLKSESILKYSQKDYFSIIEGFPHSSSFRKKSPAPEFNLRLGSSPTLDVPFVCYVGSRRARTRGSIMPMSMFPHVNAIGARILPPSNRSTLRFVSTLLTPEHRRMERDFSPGDPYGYIAALFPFKHLDYADVVTKYLAAIKTAIEDHEIGHLVSSIYLVSRNEAELTYPSNRNYCELYDLIDQHLKQEVDLLHSKVAHVLDADDCFIQASTRRELEHDRLATRPQILKAFTHYLINAVPIIYHRDEDVIHLSTTPFPSAFHEGDMHTQDFHPTATIGPEYLGDHFVDTVDRITSIKEEGAFPFFLGSLPGLLTHDRSFSRERVAAFLDRVNHDIQSPSPDIHSRHLSRMRAALQQQRFISQYAYAPEEACLIFSRTFFSPGIVFQSVTEAAFNSVRVSPDMHSVLPKMPSRFRPLDERTTVYSPSFSLRLNFNRSRPSYTSWEGRFNPEEDHWWSNPFPGAGAGPHSFTTQRARIASFYENKMEHEESYFQYRNLNWHSIDLTPEHFRTSSVASLPVIKKRIPMPI